MFPGAVPETSFPGNSTTKNQHFMKELFLKKPYAAPQSELLQLQLEGLVAQSLIYNNPYSEEIEI